MKNKKISLILSAILVITMLFGTFSAAATEVTTTGPAGTTDAVVSTTAPADDEHSDEYWDGYYDGYDEGYNDAAGEDYDSGYEDGYYDGLGDGYSDGYYQGYYDGVNAFREPSIFEKVENFFYELKYRIEEFFYRIQDFFEKLFKTGDYTEPTNPDNNDFIPDGSQPNLAGDADAEALCAEFNNLIDNFMEVKEPVAITNNVDVAVEIKELPAAVEGVANALIEQFLVNDSTTSNYVAGDYAYEVQSTALYPAGLASAEKTVNADGTTDYKFVLVAEAAYFNGLYTCGVKLVDGEIVETDLQHDYAADTLYIEYADLDPVTITSAEIYYPGATITAKTDAKGRVIAYDVNMPVSGTGEAKIAMINVVANLEGYRNEGFVAVYSD